MIAKSGICFALGHDPVDHAQDEATRPFATFQDRNPFDIGLSRESCDIGNEK
jgi:hypothetical protein